MTVIFGYGGSSIKEVFRIITNVKRNVKDMHIYVKF